MAPGRAGLFDRGDALHQLCKTNLECCMCPRVAVACQGGGSHAAFVAGVLRRILREDLRERIDLLALSGCFRGAICAGLAWAGLVSGGPEDANARLGEFWSGVEPLNPAESVLQSWASSHEAGYRRRMSDLRSGSIRQLIYRSRSVSSGPVRRQDLSDILAESRANNGIEGISGVLLATGGRYIQVLEGSPESVELIYGRIQTDRRHSDVVLVHDGLIERRAFGDWTMANLDQDETDQVALRLKRFLISVDDHVRRAFAEIV
jgi:hypothetical protein